MNKFIWYIQYFWAKQQPLFSKVSSINIYHNGQFKVHYNDGSISKAMDYKSAQKYADIFGGKVVFIRPYPCG